MARIRSTQKPDETKTKQSVKLDFNDKTYKSYIEQGFERIDIPHSVKQPYDFKQQFLRRADTTKAPIRREISAVHRYKARDEKDPKRTKKEYFRYKERWIGLDWRGVPLPPCDNEFEGQWGEQIKGPIFAKDSNEITGYERLGENTINDLLWSKKKLDSIIENSLGTDKDDITYTVIFSSMDSAQFEYDEFANLSFDELYNLARQRAKPGVNPVVVSSANSNPPMTTTTARDF